jgi:hypothetical protein
MRFDVAGAFGRDLSTIIHDGIIGKRLTKRDHELQTGFMWRQNKWSPVFGIFDQNLSADTFFQLQTGFSGARRQKANYRTKIELLLDLMKWIEEGQSLVRHIHPRNLVFLSIVRVSQLITVPGLILHRLLKNFFLFLACLLHELILGSHKYSKFDETPTQTSIEGKIADVKRSTGTIGASGGPAQQIRVDSAKNGSEQTGQGWIGSMDTE